MYLIQDKKFVIDTIGFTIQEASLLVHAFVVTTNMKDSSFYDESDSTTSALFQVVILAFIYTTIPKPLGPPRIITVLVLLVPVEVGCGGSGVSTDTCRFRSLSLSLSVISSDVSPVSFLLMFVGLMVYLFVSKPFIRQDPFFFPGFAAKSFVGSGWTTCMT